MKVKKCRYPYLYLLGYLLDVVYLHSPGIGNIEHGEHLQPYYNIMYTKSY